MTSPRIENVDVGDELPELQPDVSLAPVRRYAEAARMSFGRFTDHEQARKEGLPGAIVPGNMSQAILAALIHRWAPGARIVKIDTVFRAPVLVDSKPICRGVVTDIDAETGERDKGGRIEVDLTITNEAGETRVMGTAIVEL